MYFTVREDNEMILDSSSRCPDPQEQANFFKCAVYIIEGEHTGLSAEPEPEGDKE